MEYQLSVSDAENRHMIVLSLNERMANQNAIDVVFDVLGTEESAALVAAGTLAEGQLEDFKALQTQIFDRDAEGMFIRDDVSFLANGKDLNPDAPLSRAFVQAQKEGIDYRRCNLVVRGGLRSALSGDVVHALKSENLAAGTQHGSISELAYLFFLHQIAVGAPIDVTKDYPEIHDLIARAEKEELVQIDVKKAAYALTEKGKRVHDSYIEEAQSLIRRYDIFGDVDVESSGKAHFDTGLGKDWRVPVFEIEGVDPFRARFLLGLNDGEWDGLENWMDVIQNEQWYRQIFQPIESAPSVDEIGKPTLQNVINQGKALIRSES